MYQDKVFDLLSDNLRAIELKENYHTNSNKLDISINSHSHVKNIKQAKKMIQ